MEYILVLGALGIGSYILTQNREREESKGDKDMQQSKEMLNKDLAEAGVSWGNQKVSDLNLTDLNSANTPYGAPRQQSTNDYSEVAQDQAERSTFVKRYLPDFYFRNNIEVPIAHAAASVYNIELPSLESVQGDHDSKLGRFPRAYVDYHGQRPHYFTGESGTMGAMGASQPEVWEEGEVPLTGQLNFEQNPYGPGGAVQNLMNTGNENIVKQRGVNQATVIGPPLFGESRGFIV